MTEHNIKLSDLEGLDLEDFDPAEYITSDEAAAAYITQALETNDAAIFAAAIGDIARARGMAEIAKAAGLGRESLYKALRPNSQPRMETMTRVLGALGVRLVAEVIGSGETVAEESVAIPKRVGRSVAKKAMGRRVRVRGKAAVV
ncbi:addiction module antidote protein [Janthinobacterium sp. P210005]|uniref:addiction module antidote protein n=1 Tax=Janthinobacterium sp. P210005 TaxID=3112938 RepID=UPI002E25EAF8|nr:addiction module antidote protein [Janthinobacterium sp. P210005]